jgi:hypothetical protein
MAGATRARKLSASFMGGRAKGGKKDLDETLAAAAFSVVSACATIVLAPESDAVRARWMDTLKTSVRDIGRGKQGILRVSSGVEGQGLLTVGASAAKSKAAKETFLSCFCVLSVNGTLQFFEDHKQLKQVMIGSMTVDHDTELVKGVEINATSDNDHFAIRCAPSAAAAAADPSALGPLLFFCAPSKQEKTDWLKRVSNHIALPPHPADAALPNHASIVHPEQASMACMGSLEVHDSGDSGKPTVLKSALCWLEKGVFKVYKDCHSLDSLLEFTVTGDSFVRRPSASAEANSFQVLNNRRALSLGPVREAGAPLVAHLAILARWEAAFMQHIRVYGTYTFDDDPLLSKASQLAEVPSLTSQKAAKSAKDQAESPFYTMKLTSADQVQHMLGRLHRSGEWAHVQLPPDAADADDEERTSKAEADATTTALAAQLTIGSALRAVDGELVPLYSHEDAIARLERYSSAEAWETTQELDVEMRKFPQYQGELQLQEGGKKGSWKSRYMMLGEGQLRVFDKKGGELKSKLRLACCTIGLLAGADVGGKLFCFTMVEHGEMAENSTRRVFQAKNNKECLDWAGRLCNAVAMSNGGGHILQLETHDLAKTVHNWFDRAANAAAAALGFQPGKKGEDGVLMVKARIDVFAYMARAEGVKIALNGGRASSSTTLDEEIASLESADVTDGAEIAQVLRAFYSNTATATAEVSEKLARMKPHIREQAMKKKFLSFDYDGDGKLNEIEAMTLASELQKTLSLDELSDAMEKLELEHQKEPLGFEKFSTWFKTDLTPKAKSSIVSDFFALRGKFREYARAPKNDDHRGEDAEAILQEHGVMSRAALRRLAEDCGVELRDPSEVSAAFAVISSSNSGITALDFEKWWKAAKESEEF